MSDRQIVECAKRLVAKLAGEKYYTMNGEFSPKIKTEIKRMKHLCDVSSTLSNQVEE